MPVNDFEKQVQQKMDELQLRPSGEVWTEVEKRIRREKQRRRFVLWFFISGILLLGGTAWWMTSTGNRQKPEQIAHTQTAGDKPVDAAGNGQQTNKTIDPHSSNNNPVAQQPTTDPNNGSSTTITNNTDQTLNNSDNKTYPSTKPTGSVGKTSANNRLEIETEKSAANKRNRNSNTAQPTDNTTGKVPVTNAPVPIINDKTNSPLKPADKNIPTPATDKTADKSVPVKTPNKPLTTDQPAKDSVVADSLVVKTNVTEPTSPVPDPVNPKKKKQSKKGKWEFGIAGSAGVSRLTDGFPIFNTSAEKMLSADPQVIPNAAAGAYPAYQAAPSAPEEGPYWQVSVYAKRKLTARTGLSAGLQFSSFTTTQAIGKYVNIPTNINNYSFSSDVANYYRSGEGTVYRNHYNYLQVPVAFHWQINKSKNLPVIWQNGFTVGVLTGSDGLIYTPSSNLFYHDNKLLSKPQFSLQSGLSVRLLEKSKHPVSVGFLFNYHLTNLQKVQTSGNNNLSSFGVHAGWIIKK